MGLRCRCWVWVSDVGMGVYKLLYGTDDAPVYSPFFQVRISLLIVKAA